MDPFRCFQGIQFLDRSVEKRPIFMDGLAAWIIGIKKRGLYNTSQSPHVSCCVRRVNGRGKPFERSHGQEIQLFEGSQVFPVPFRKHP